ncbi:MAG: adenylate/guanylate cyclase domain-containing protein [Acetobacteraceae bacterium]|nr:adenylate/guanylate cyclase domain-containing protein [Acetobacteraceae bacterium]
MTHAAAVTSPPGTAARARRWLGLGADAADLPRRVQALVVRQQDTAEIIIGVMQAMAIATFAVLYALSRTANPPPMEIEPVPVTLALYALFTALRLWLAIRRRLGPGLLATSVVIDFTVLFLTIWSFHLQYMAPLAVVLKAPTVMYVFILITLRALRFETRWVLLAGAAAMLGWTAIVAAALLQGSAGVTRSFLAYVTSPAILIGAEFDKLVSIAMVTALLALVVARGRAVLVEAMREQIAAAELSRFFVPEIATRIRGAEAEQMAGQAERRQACILMTDLRGFTGMARAMEPDALLRLLAAYQALVVRAVRAHGGSIDKYLGDGVLASFGAVAPSDTHAADALRAIEAVQAAVADWAPPEPGMPPVTIGMAASSGEVLFGTVGAEGRLEYTVIGDPVNQTAKLEKHNKAEGSVALTDAATYALAEAQGYAPAVPIERRAARQVAGVEAPLDLVLLGRS